MSDQCRQDRRWQGGGGGHGLRPLCSPPSWSPAPSAGADAGIEGPPTWHDVVQIVLEALAGRGVKLTRKEIAEAYIRVRERANPENAGEP